MPSLIDEVDEAETEFEDNDEVVYDLGNGEVFEEGDQIFATQLPTEAEFIRAGSTISQKLVEAFHKNTPAPATRGFRDIVPGALHDFEDVFSQASFDSLSPCKPWDHAIELEPGFKQTNAKVYPLSPSEQVALDEFLQENLATGRIRPSKSPMAAPFFFVKKKDGKLRPVQDYRALNGMTIKNCYSLPLISELINQLKSARYFTKLDVRWGFNNVRIKEGDEWKAAFQMNRDLFEPLVIFFSLTNSSATFQTMINESH
jgi:hypothetical protein